MPGLLRRILAGIAVVLVLLFAIVGFLLLTRRAPAGTVRAFGDSTPSVADSTFIHALENLAGAPLRSGHTVRILSDGDETYPALWHDLRQARRSITISNYYAQPGELTDTLGAVLRARARAGVSVRFLYDAFGSGPLTDEWLDSLAAAGVRVAAFRPVRWYALHKASERSHARAIVVDGHIGYTGGFGFADYWLGDGVRRGWRETNVRFEGPTVAALQASFVTAWAEATGQLLVGEQLFPPPDSAAGDVTAGVLYAVPAMGVTPASRFIALTVAGARESLHITNSYFVPDRQLREQLMRAAQRGVDVRLLLPDEGTDVPITRYAARAEYEELLESGIRIFEYQPQMVHAKTLVVDGVLASIGSINLDARSMSFNIESALIVHDTSFAAALDSVFADDLRHAREIRLDTFRQRSFWQRVLEWGADAVGRFL